MRGAIPPFPQYVFMEWCLVKHRDTFTFLTFFYLPSAQRPSHRVEKWVGSVWDFFPSLLLQTGSGAHPDSNPVGTGGSYPGDKAGWA
jgi:hypothetical protein